MPYFRHRLTNYQASVLSSISLRISTLLSLRIRRRGSRRAVSPRLQSMRAVIRTCPSLRETTPCSAPGESVVEAGKWEPLLGTSASSLALNLLSCLFLFTLVFRPNSAFVVQFKIDRGEVNMRINMIVGSLGRCERSGFVWVPLCGCFTRRIKKPARGDALPVICFVRFWGG